MIREQLRPFRNKNVVVTGRVEYVGYKNKLNRDIPYLRNVKILLKDVQINVAQTTIYGCLSDKNIMTLLFHFFIKK